MHSKLIFVGMMRMKRYILLGDVITKSSVERCGERQLPILSITIKDGLVLQDEKFKKRIASVDTSEYKVIPRGKLVQGIHIDEANFGIQDIVDQGIVSPAYKVWDVKSDIIFPKYLEMIMRSPRSLAFYKSKLNGSVNRRGRMTDSDFLGMLIPYTDYQEQEKVVEIINRIKGIIFERERQLSALDDLIKARFVEMFGDCNDLVDAGSIMFNMRNGVSPSTRGQYQERVLTLSAVTQGAFDPTMWKEGLFDTVPPADKRVSTKDFYMCRGNGNKSLVGAGVYSAVERDDLVFPDTVIAAHVDLSKICLPYLFTAWKQPKVRNQIEAGARTTNGTFKINQQIISKVEIPLPPLCEQQQFSAFVAQIDKSKYDITLSACLYKQVSPSYRQERVI